MPTERRIADLLRVRLSSPLRWLCAVMGGLMALGIAGLFQSPPLMLVAPVIFGLFLLAPPVGIYRHAEAPTLQTRVRLDATPLDPVGSAAVFQISLINEGEIEARNFRIRLLVPTDLVPVESAQRALGSFHMGELGKHWFTETTYTATAITFRAGKPDDVRAVSCPAGERCALFNLHLPLQRAPYDLFLNYQVNGGSVVAALADVRIRSQ
jgi:hypothetical protein